MRTILLAVLGVGLGCAGTEARPSGQDLRRDFADPPLRWKSRPLWFWNGPLSRERTAQTLEGCRAAGYAGVGSSPPAA